MVEDDCMDAYTASYRPGEGDVVWDVGAHAGMTTYFLSQMVGATGRVYMRLSRTIPPTMSIC